MPFGKVVKVALAAGVMVAAAQAQRSAEVVLQPENFQHYAAEFAAQEMEATHAQAADAWPWMRAEIPWFEASDKRFEEMYYFRWYAWQKHVVKTKAGWVVTEWLPKPEEKDGFYGALPDAAPLHLGEARWLRDARIAEDDARYWMSPEADPRKYSVWMATAVRDVTLANGDKGFRVAELPAMKSLYAAWGAQRDANGLYWSIDTRDAMEKSISGDGYRPTLNSYMYGDARTIAEVAKEAGDAATQQKFAAEAERVRGLIEGNLWNEKDRFYEVMSPAKESGIRAQKRFIDNGTAMKISGTRELLGYIPWMFDEAPANHVAAWEQLFDAQGFAGKYGPTTVERRSPRFRFESSDQCTWNGPSWPFATTQTLAALRNLLQSGEQQKVIAAQQYYALFDAYVLSQHIALPGGKTIPWIDEDLDADTDEWIAKRMLKEKNKQVGRGNYYNHSGFADPLITGLLGIVPAADDVVRVKPLLPQGQWTYFALDGLPYHGHVLALVFDATGKRYGKGAGLRLFVDGKMAAERKDLGPLTAELKGATK